MGHRLKLLLAALLFASACDSNTHPPAPPPISKKQPDKPKPPPPTPHPKPGPQDNPPAPAGPCFPLQLEVVDGHGHIVAIKELSIECKNDPARFLNPRFIDDGTIRMDSAEEGTYEIQFSLKDEREAAISLTIRHDRKRTVRLTLGPADVSGRVKLGQEPCVGADISMESAPIEIVEGVVARASFRSITDPLGVFKFSRAIPGAYLVLCGGVSGENERSGPIALHGQKLYLERFNESVVGKIKIEPGIAIDLGDAFILREPDASLQIGISGARRVPIRLLSLAPIPPPRPGGSYGARLSLNTETDEDGQTKPLEVVAGPYLLKIPLKAGAASVCLRKIIDVKPGLQTEKIELPSDIRPGTLKVDPRRLLEALKKVVPQDKRYLVRTGVNILGGPQDWPKLDDPRAACDAGFQHDFKEANELTIDGLLAGKYTIIPFVCLTALPPDNGDFEAFQVLRKETWKLQEELDRRVGVRREVHIYPGAVTPLEVSYEK